MDNMHNAELYGRARQTTPLISPPPCSHAIGAEQTWPLQVLRCNFAQPMKIKGGEAGFATQPGVRCAVWKAARALQKRSSLLLGSSFLLTTAPELAVWADADEYMDKLQEAEAK